MSDTALAPLEHDRLSACEETIESGLKTFTDVGNALLVIRDERLYRAKYGTFEDYCQKRWNMERRHAYRLIDSAEVVRNVSNWTQTTPDSESVARPLTGLSPDVQREVWQEAVDTAPNGKVTAKHVQEVVDRRTGEVIDDPEIITTTRKRPRFERQDMPEIQEPQGNRILIYDLNASDTAVSIYRAFGADFSRTLVVALTELCEAEASEQTPQTIETTTATTRRPIHTETHEVSDAFTFVEIAISQLSRIRDDDPKRDTAFRSVADWIQANARPRSAKPRPAAKRVNGTFDDAQTMLDTFKSINDMLDSLKELKPKQSMTVLVTEAARDTGKSIGAIVTRIEKGVR